MSIIVNSMWGFVFALMKCSYAAFGEQNKTNNDSKCQQVYKSYFFTENLGFYLIPTKKTRKKCIFNKKNRNLEQKHPKKSLIQRLRQYHTGQARPPMMN